MAYSVKGLTLGFSSDPEMGALCGTPCSVGGGGGPARTFSFSALLLFSPINHPKNKQTKRTRTKRDLGIIKLLALGNFLNSPPEDLPSGVTSFHGKPFLVVYHSFPNPAEGPCLFQPDSAKTPEPGLCSNKYTTSLRSRVSP